MRALRLLPGRSEPVLADVPRPRPGPGEVVVRVGGSGVCRTDLLLPGGPRAAAFTLGHENAGWVYETGPGVTGVEAGDPVAVCAAWGCGSCVRCAAGREASCEQGRPAPSPPGPGRGRDGGMAEFLLVPAVRWLVPLPGGLDPAEAAPLVCAGSAALHAVRGWEPPPDAVAVVVGAGTVGQLAVQLLRALTSARIAVVDARPGALAAARLAGADLALPPGEVTSGTLTLWSAGRGADLVLDAAGTAGSPATAAAVVRAGGTIVRLHHRASGTLDVAALPSDTALRSVTWGSRDTLTDVLDLAAAGTIVPRVTTFPLEKAPAVYGLLRDDALEDHAVITP
ncbi:alcohol dehydrogenase catalytic domain-containing protein [Actinomadura flavalba]|uniref:alcohol dehydrogenase catalytic domain-containing protein n=1 Tax=Actinomadura flavalba TaxID=1120938 RepID=UPI00036E5E3E|nr:alcohol dehydrogenase catalytic domain-containing protein [Actinomadura flavalba]